MQQDIEDGVIHPSKGRKEISRLRKQTRADLVEILGERGTQRLHADLRSNTGSAGFDG